MNTIVETFLSKTEQNWHKRQTVDSCKLELDLCFRYKLKEVTGLSLVIPHFAESQITQSRKAYLTLTQTLTALDILRNGRTPRTVSGNDKNRLSWQIARCEPLYS